MKKKEVVTISSELFVQKTANLIEDTIKELKQSAEESGLRKGDSFIDEMLLLTMFSSKLETILFKEDDNTEITDNESEVTL